MNFSQQSPKMFKIASDIFIHAFLLFLGLFFQNFPLGVPAFSTVTLAFCTSNPSIYRSCLPRILSPCIPSLTWRLEPSPPICSRCISGSAIIKSRQRQYLESNKQETILSFMQLLLANMASGINCALFLLVILCLESITGDEHTHKVGQ